MTSRYFISNTYLGESPRPGAWNDDEFLGESLLFVCPTCGDPWGRIITPSRPWMTVMRACEGHKAWGDTPPGSMLLSWRHKQLLELPLLVLKREFLLLYEHRRKTDETLSE